MIKRYGSDAARALAWLTRPWTTPKKLHLRSIDFELLSRIWYDLVNEHFPDEHHAIPADILGCALLVGTLHRRIEKPDRINPNLIVRELNDELRLIRSDLKTYQLALRSLPALNALWHIDDFLEEIQKEKAEIAIAAASGLLTTDCDFRHPDIDELLIRVNTTTSGSIAAKNLRHLKPNLPFSHTQIDLLTAASSFIGSSRYKGKNTDHTADHFLMTLHDRNPDLVAQEWLIDAADKRRMAIAWNLIGPPIKRIKHDQPGLLSSAAWLARALRQPITLHHSLSPFAAPPLPPETGTPDDKP